MTHVDGPRPDPREGCRPRSKELDIRRATSSTPLPATRSCRRSSHEEEEHGARQRRDSATSKASSAAPKRRRQHQHLLVRPRLIDDPAENDVMSVGAVCWPEYLKTAPARPRTLVQTEARARRLRAHERRDADGRGACHRYSRTAPSAYRQRLHLVGDAFAFIDPCLERVYLAMSSARAGPGRRRRAARPQQKAELHAAYDERTRRGIPPSPGSSIASRPPHALDLHEPAQHLAPRRGSRTMLAATCSTVRVERASR